MTLPWVIHVSSFALHSIHCGDASALHSGLGPECERWPRIVFATTATSWRWRWRWRWCCTLSRPRLAPGAVRAAVAGGRHFWAAVLWLVARWTRWPTYVVAERWLPQGADNGRFMADIIPPALCSTIPDLIPVPLWGSSSVQK